MKPTFSKAEMEGRLSKLRSYMEKDSIGGVLFTSYHSINYYSDFLYLAFGRPYGLVVTPDKVVIISSLIDYGQPDRYLYLPTYLCRRHKVQPCSGLRWYPPPIKWRR